MAGDPREAAKLDYLAGLKPAAIADAYGVPIRKVRSWITEGKWRDQRQAVRQQVDEQLPARVAEAVLDEVERVTRDHVRLAGVHLELYEEVLQQLRPPASAGADGDAAQRAVQLAAAAETARVLALLSRSLKAGVGVQRLALGIAPPRPVDRVPGDPSTSGVIEIPAMDPAPVPPSEEG